MVVGTVSIQSSRLRFVGKKMRDGNTRRCSNACIYIGNYWYLFALRFTYLTGPPKGCMITQNNILEIMNSWQEFSEIVQCYVLEDDYCFEFLPLAHVAERIVGFYWRVNTGMVGIYASGSRVL